MRTATTAERLQIAMDDARMQPADLAKAANINKGSLSRYLSGEREPKQITANKMAIALNVSEMWLWGYDVPKERDVKKKENDDLVEITVRMRRDVAFFKAVKSLYKLSAEDFETIDRLLSTLDNK